MRRAELLVFSPDIESEGRVAEGDYQIITGNSEPLNFDPNRLVVITGDRSLQKVFPGVVYRGWYTAGDNTEEQSLPVVSFMYHKLDGEGRYEAYDRAIVLQGTGYGEHSGHRGQLAARYLIGSQIGKLNFATGEFVDILDHPAVIQPKHFSIACMVDGTPGELVTANPS